MKAGACWPATTVNTEGLSALVAGGCGYPAGQPGPVWTSAAPAFSPPAVLPDAGNRRIRWGG